MAGRNTNIYFPEETYNRLREVAGVKISRFVSEAVEEKLQKTEQERKEDLKKKIIKGYQADAKNNKLQAELKAMEATSVEDVFTMLEKRENEQSK